MTEATLVETQADTVVVVIPKDEWEAHMKRVEGVFNLVEKMLTSLAANPMFAGMLPPDVQQDLRNAGG
jgi:malate synthase